MINIEPLNKRYNFTFLQNRQNYSMWCTFCCRSCYMSGTNSLQNVPFLSNKLRLSVM